jgi:hypothetical protein
VRLLIFVLLDVDHSMNHAHSRRHQHVVAHLIAAKLVAAAACI